VTPRSRDELIEAIGWLKTCCSSFFTLGGGSNVLIGDGVIDIPVLRTTETRDLRVSVDGENVFIDCAAGTKLSEVLALTIKEGWSGLEFAAGIPGTVGGALSGNAGTLRGAMDKSVVMVQTVEEDGSKHEWKADDMKWGYRRCGLLENTSRVVIGAKLKLSLSDRGLVLAAVKEALESRGLQPCGHRTAGCVFKNPQGHSAGMLLDRAECKGLVVGGARVSAAHANFIENMGACSARNIMQLALICKKRVFEMFGVTLSFEIKTLGIQEEDIYVGR
jgi:UDP-N-acetylmuramate dehydrogenase